ncbi:MAG: molecular chaperone DnaJ [Clostridia bacterium]|nr:molecular chaperone DnaJ [Clostridia bacterium]
MAEKRDYYAVLGVEKNATENEIKSAFRKRAKDCHPDLHPDDKAKEAEFKELNEAYAVLSDSEKRSKYDQFGHAAFDPSMGGGNPFAGFNGADFDFGGFGDIFSSFFGGGFSSGSVNRNTPMAGDDLRYSMTISFEEAAFGVTKEILIPREEACSACKGSGAKAGTTPVRCTSCNGTGRVRVQQNTFMGAITSTRDCPNCRGTGQIIKEPCPECKGKGRVRKSARVQLKIPAGIDDGQTLNLRGEGEAGYRGGPRGNLYVTISVRPHKLFTRRGYDLLLRLPIPYTTAALGGEITVPTLSGQVKYNVPSGTPSETVFRLRDQGVQRLNSNGKGDLLVTVTVDVPKKLSDEEKELLRRLSELQSGAQPNKGKKGFFKK